jgi:hypothetical protein
MPSAPRTATSAATWTCVSSLVRLPCWAPSPTLWYAAGSALVYSSLAIYICLALHALLPPVCLVDVSWEVTDGLSLLQQDMQNIFSLIDTDRSGKVNEREFVEVRTLLSQ